MDEMVVSMGIITGGRYQFNNKNFPSISLLQENRMDRLNE